MVSVDKSLHMFTPRDYSTRTEENRVVGTRENALFGRLPGTIGPI
jgi:hypothetical protein